MKIIIMLDEPMPEMAAHAAAIELLSRNANPDNVTVVVPNTDQVPDNIPRQIEFIARAKLGDQRARAAIERLHPNSWMRESLDSPQWAGGAYEPKGTVFDR